MGIGRGGMCCSVALQQGEILHGLGAKPWCWVFPPPLPVPTPSWRKSAPLEQNSRNNP